MAGQNPVRRRVLAVASSGGHWQQLMQLRPAYDDCHVRYLTTQADLPATYGLTDFALVPDCNREDLWASAKCLALVTWQILRFRPSVVISTGALPGLIALAVGKATRARTIWVDSVANAEEMSMSGKTARRFADLWLSQWEEVARACNADYAGAIL